MTMPNVQVNIVIVIFQIRIHRELQCKIKKQTNGPTNAAPSIQLYMIETIVSFQTSYLNKQLNCWEAKLLNCDIIPRHDAPPRSTCMHLNQTFCNSNDKYHQSPNITKPSALNSWVSVKKFCLCVRLSCHCPCSLLPLVCECVRRTQALFVITPNHENMIGTNCKHSYCG